METAREKLARAKQIYEQHKGTEFAFNLRADMEAALRKVQDLCPHIQKTTTVEEEIHAHRKVKAEITTCKNCGRKWRKILNPPSEEEIKHWAMR